MCNAPVGEDLDAFKREEGTEEAVAWVSHNRQQGFGLFSLVGEEGEPPFWLRGLVVAAEKRRGQEVVDLIQLRSRAG